MATKKTGKKNTKNKQVKSLHLRVPASYHADLERIREITGSTFNTICKEILRTGIKAKLKELLEEK